MSPHGKLGLGLAASFWKRAALCSFGPDSPLLGYSSPDHRHELVYLPVSDGL